MHNINLAEISDIGAVIPVVAMLLGGTFVVSGMYFKHQRRRLWHETARIALEKGQPLPPQLLDEKFDHSSRDDLNQRDLRGGMVLVAAGLGLYLFLLRLAPPGVSGLAFFGAIPGFIGIALLLHWALTALSRSKKTNSTPPRS